MTWTIMDQAAVERTERRGAIELLSTCTNFMPARSALEMLESGVPPSAAGQALASFFHQQEERIQQLERELQSCQFELKQSKSLLASFYNDPDHARWLKAEQQLKEQTQHAERAEKEEANAHSMLERERKYHAETVAKLQNEVQEQQSIIAQQHLKLEELLGDDTHK